LQSAVPFRANTISDVKPVKWEKRAEMQLQLSLQVIIREKREKVKEKQERKGSKKITSYIT
jgi:hypothetical protein